MHEISKNQIGTLKVFKFGGASVKDAKSVENLAHIVKAHQEEKLVVVVSAMGKMTNAFEELLAKSIAEEPFEEFLNEIKEFHANIIRGLELHHDADLQSEIEATYEQLSHGLNGYSSSFGYDFVYDQTVSLAEILSTKITAAYLNKSGLNTSWVDARKMVKTDNMHRQAMVDWGATQAMIKSQVGPLLDNSIVLTQGFIGSNAKYNTTTLGREGSDFTAAIFGTSLKATSVAIWKDVPGVLNADPKKFENTKKYPRLPYKEAAEMTYYGASVIHPKTIKPLAQHGIPLHVRSFLDMKDEGTVIEECVIPNLNPAIIHKDQQTVISFKISDFSFINEHHIHLIFEHIKRLNLTIHLMQNSAISFTVCIDDNPKKREQLMNGLNEEFRIYYNEGLEMITVKNYDQKTVDELVKNKQVIIEQRSRNNFQIVYKNQ